MILHKDHWLARLVWTNWLFRWVKIEFVRVEQNYTDYVRIFI